jgi:hypothetical protein
MVAWVRANGNKDMSGRDNWRRYTSLRKSSGKEEGVLNGYFKGTLIADIFIVRLMGERKNAPSLP